MDELINASEILLGKPVGENRVVDAGVNIKMLLQ
jgi:tetrahydrodipicolinate N-succinyltransferase